MKIATKPRPSARLLKMLTWGTPFSSKGVLYSRTNPGVHLDAAYGWGQEVGEGLLTKFDLDKLVDVIDGEFVPS